MVTVLKLGGSVLTDKARRETVDQDALDRAASLLGDWHDAGSRPSRTTNDVADGPADLVVVHGGGSFGHHHADAHEVSDTVGSHSVGAVEDVHGAMCRFNGTVVDSLRQAEIPAVPVHPFSAGSRDASGNLTMPSHQLSTMLSEGFVPVLHGDLVVHAGEGVSVLSGDELVVSLASSLSADRVGVCSTVAGVLDADGQVIPVVESLDDVVDALSGSDTTDVTGGMAGKVRSLLDLSAPATIFDLDGLERFLAGDSPGTEVRG